MAARGVLEAAGWPSRLGDRAEDLQGSWARSQIISNRVRIRCLQASHFSLTWTRKYYVRCRPMNFCAREIMYVECWVLLDQEG